MNASHLEVFCSPTYPHVALTFEGERDGGDLLNGRILAGAHEVGRVVGGVAIFCEQGPRWPPADIETLRREGFVARKWADQLRHPPPAARERLLAALAGVEGILLEVASGVGGGNVPRTLQRNPGARILMNDVAAGPLELWRGFFTESGHGRNVGLAAFDACEMPLRDGCIAAVSDAAGFANIPHGERAIREAARVLRPGGLLCSVDLAVDADDWARMPAEVRSGWERDFPSTTRGWAPIIEEAGLCVERCETEGGRELMPGEDGLADTAARYGVRLRAVYQHITARKPGERRSPESS